MKNNFSIYRKNKIIHKDITCHVSESEKIINEFIDGFRDKDILEKEADLDLLHLILKHGRSCDSDCIVKLKYIDLFNLITTEAIEHLRAKNTTKMSYPLLVCMLDILKNDPTWLDSVKRQQFLQIACSLWNHEKIYKCRKSMEICNLLVPLVPCIDTLLESVIAYIQSCRSEIKKKDLDRLRSLDYTEFFYHPTDTQFTFDRVTLKLIIQLVLAIFLKQDLNIKYMALLHNEIKDLMDAYTNIQIKEFLFDIYCVNDDDTTHLLNTILLIYQQEQHQYLDLLRDMDINPHTLFLYFLQRCGDTHDILVDLLLENDSDFLPYFHRYVIYATNDIAQFKLSMAELGYEFEDIHTIMANLIIVIDGDGFPYNTKPLIRRLVQFNKALL